MKQASFDHGGRSIESDESFDCTLLFDELGRGSCSAKKNHPRGDNSNTNEITCSKTRELFLPLNERGGFVLGEENLYENARNKLNRYEFGTVV